MLKVHRAQVIFLSLRRATKHFFIMATGNMMLGQARGSVGDLTFYRRDGKQVTRAKVSQVSNPKSSLQMIQRMIFATVAAAYARMKSICDHSFEGVQYGAKSQAKFMSLNLDRLRAFYPTSADPTAHAEVDTYKDIAFAAKSNAADSGTGLIIAKGTIPAPAVQVVDGVLKGFGSGTIEGTPPTIASVVEKLGAERGDQITIAALLDINGTVVCKKSRYVLNADPLQGWSGEWDGSVDDPAFDQTKSDISSDLVLSVNTTSKVLEPKAPAGQTIIAATVILSRQDNSGKWLRSDAVMYNYQDEGASYAADYALNTWQFAGTSIDAANDRFLNNADI